MTIPKGYQLPPMIVLNATPIAGVLFLDWAVFDLVFLYWLENLFIGVFMIARMVIRHHEHIGSVLGSLFMAAFFTVHYGMFTAIHGIFVFSMFGHSELLGDSAILGAILAIPETLNRNYLAWFAVALLTIHLVEWLMEVFDSDNSSPAQKDLTAAPYQRIFVLHVTIIAGGFLLMSLNDPLAGLLVLVVVKTGYDLYAFRQRNLNPDDRTEGG